MYGTSAGWPGATTLADAFFDGTKGFYINYSTSSGLPYAIDTQPIVADVNADGYPDIIVADTSANANKGAVYILFGPSGGWPATSTTLNASLIDGVHAVEIDGAVNGNVAGGVNTSISESSNGIAVGDINKDGYPDLLIVAPGYAAKGVSNSSAVWGIWGAKASTWANSPKINLGNVH